MILLITQSAFISSVRVAKTSQKWYNQIPQIYPKHSHKSDNFVLKFELAQIPSNL